MSAISSLKSLATKICICDTDEKKGHVPGKNGVSAFAVQIIRRDFLPLLTAVEV
jgi:hypothetical protein